MGTHPIFESDFDCLTEWVAVEVDLDRVKRNLERNQEEVVPEVVSVNEVEIVKIDRDQGTGKEKIAIAIDVVAVVNVNEMIKDHHLRVPERIQFVGSKLLPNHDNHHIEKHHLVKLLFYSEKMLYLKPQKIFANFVQCKKAMVLKDHHSTELFPVLCAKVVISLNTMALVVNQFMGKSLLMKTLN